MVSPSPCPGFVTMIDTEPATKSTQQPYICRPRAWLQNSLGRHATRRRPAREQRLLLDICCEQLRYPEKGAARHACDLSKIDMEASLQGRTRRHSAGGHSGPCPEMPSLPGGLHCSRNGNWNFDVRCNLAALSGYCGVPRVLVIRCNQTSANRFIAFSFTTRANRRSTILRK